MNNYRFCVSVCNDLFALHDWINVQFPDTEDAEGVRHSPWENRITPRIYSPDWKVCAATAAYLPGDIVPPMVQLFDSIAEAKAAYPDLPWTITVICDDGVSRICNVFPILAGCGLA